MEIIAHALIETCCIQLAKQNTNRQRKHCTFKNGQKNNLRTLSALVHSHLGSRSSNSISSQTFAAFPCSFTALDTLLTSLILLSKFSTLPWLLPSPKCRFRHPLFQVCKYSTLARLAKELSIITTSSLMVTTASFILIRLNRREISCLLCSILR